LLQRSRNKNASVLWDSYGGEEVKTLNSDYYFHTVEELREFLLEQVKLLSATKAN